MSRWVMVAVFFAAACGSDDRRLDRATAEDSCRSYCEHQCECDGGCSSIGSCVDGCTGAARFYYRRGVWADEMACLSSASCEGVTDCFSCEPTDAHLAYEEECKTVAGGCGFDADEVQWNCETRPTSMGHRWCMLVPEFMTEEAAECLTLPCVDIAWCLGDVALRGGV